MVIPTLTLKLIRPYNNAAESWNNKIKSYTNNKFCNPIDLHKALIGILKFRCVEMGRALRGLGELTAQMCFVLTIC